MLLVLQALPCVHAEALHYRSLFLPPEILYVIGSCWLSKSGQAVTVC